MLSTVYICRWQDQVKNKTVVDMVPKIFSIDSASISPQANGPYGYIEKIYASSSHW